MKLSAPIHRLKHQAKLLTREASIPLHEALDRIARAEGYATWSLLAARDAATTPAARTLARLQPGDLLLLGARPGQGKTLLGLELIVEAVKQGRRGRFYTLEYNEAEVARRLQQLGADAGKPFPVVVSDAISADFIIARERESAPGSLVVIDYLQILDQDRRKPDLAAQVTALKSFAEETQLILVFISQIDRSYDSAKNKLPGLGDIRLPNPLDLSLFSKACFLNDGAFRIQSVR